MAKKRSSFGNLVADGIPSAPANQKNTYGSQDKPVSLISSPVKEDVQDSSNHSMASVNTMLDQNGVNPYYQYHPKKGAQGGNLGAPRTAVKRIQISIGCTPEEKQLYNTAAIADGRRLSDFIKCAVLEYIDNHNLNI